MYKRMQSIPVAKCFGEMILATLGISLTHWESPSVLGEIEAVAINWLGRLVNLPKEMLFMENLETSPGGGTFTENSNESLLLAILSARTKKIKGSLDKKKIFYLPSGENDLEMRTVARTSRIVVYGKVDAFSQLERICQMTYVEVRRFETVGSLERLVQEDIEKGYQPGLLVMPYKTGDDVEQLAPVAKSHDMLIHVDCPLKSLDSCNRFLQSELSSVDTINISSIIGTIIFTRNQIQFRSLFSHVDPSKPKGGMKLRDLNSFYSRQFQCDGLGHS